jgi:hypothetical protein
MNAAGLDVSDHALLRYLERVKGIDVEAARAEVIEICKVAAHLGNYCATRDGHIYVLHGCWVTTVTGKGDRMTRHRSSEFAFIRPRGPFGERQAMRTGK